MTSHSLGVTFFVIGFLFWPGLAEGKASDFVVSGYTESGASSTAEDYKEEDTDEEYSYHKYHLKVKHQLSDLSNYSFSTFIYDKDYAVKDSLDNASKIFKTDFSYYLKKLKSKSLKLDFKIKYREKSYENKPESEYEQISFKPSLIFNKDNCYKVFLGLGINSFDYFKAVNKDPLKVFGKLGGSKYFLEEKLKLSLAYKLETIDKEALNRKQTKHELKGGFDYIFDLPWIYKIKSVLNWGQRDTKEEEERDEDYDYKYGQYGAQTEHRINPGLKTGLKYLYFKKDYLLSDLSHRGFYFRNVWDYEFLDDARQRFWFNFKAEHKEVDYILKAGRNYQKRTFEIKANYKQKKLFKVSLSLIESAYEYSDSAKDKERYYIKLFAEKLLKEGDLVLSLELKHSYTDYKENNNSGQEAWRIAFKYKF